MSQIDQNNSNIQEKLASLDSQFNTNKGFGMMGMINAEENRLRKEVEAQKETPQAAETITPETKPSDPPDWFGPINTSLQSVRGEFQQTANALAQELQQLKQSREVQQTQDESVPPEISPIIQKVTNVEKSLGTLALRTEWNRAKDALRDARGKYSEFGYTDDEFNQVWNAHVKNNPDTAANTNWENYFKTQYETRRNPKLVEENEKLKAQIAQMQSTRQGQVKDLMAVPRANRQSVPDLSQNQDDVEEELYQRAKKRMQKGRFIGFNRALIEEQQKMLVA